MNPAYMPPHEIAFAPVQPSGHVQIAKSANHIGVVLWQFANGDCLFRSVSQTWYIPSGGWEPYTSVFV